MSLAVQQFVTGYAKITDIRSVKDDKGHMRVTLSYMGGSDDVLISSDIISAFRVGDMVVYQFESRNIYYNATFGENTYVRTAKELGQIVMFRKPTKEEI